METKLIDIKQRNVMSHLQATSIYFLFISIHLKFKTPSIIAFKWKVWGGGFFFSFSRLCLDLTMLPTCRRICECLTVNLALSFYKNKINVFWFVISYSFLSFQKYILFCCKIDKNKKNKHSKRRISVTIM